MRRLGQLAIPGRESVSTIVDIPSKAHALLVLAHGAGAGMNHDKMEELAKALNERGVATFRFQFPYMQQGSRRPDSPPTAIATITAAVNAAADEVPKLPLFAGGKSFGGRMTTLAASQGALARIRGIVCFGFPLHPPKEPSTTRADHIVRVNQPILWIQGTRDNLADLSRINQVVLTYPKILNLHVVEGADHGFAVLRKLGRSREDVFKEVAGAASDFIVSLESPLRRD